MLPATAWTVVHISASQMAQERAQATDVTKTGQVAVSGNPEDQ